MLLSQAGAAVPAGLAALPRAREGRAGPADPSRTPEVLFQIKPRLSPFNFNSD